jgi:hypothetical protein
MLGGQEMKKSSSPGRTRSNGASDPARNRKGGIKDRKSSNTTVGLINYCLAMVSMTIAAVGFSDDSKRPRVKGTLNRTAVQFLVNSGASISVVSEWTFDGIWGAAELRRLPLPRHLRVAGVKGADIQVVDYVEAEMTILRLDKDETNPGGEGTLDDRGNPRLRLHQAGGLGSGQSKERGILQQGGAARSGMVNSNAKSVKGDDTRTKVST